MKRFIGDRQFYKYVFMLVIPVIIQQGITSFVNLLDNIMVGALGTEAISSVSIANQIIFISQLAVFGGLSAISIYSAQFYGKGDMEGMRYSFRAKVIFSVVISVITIVLLIFCGDFFMGLFLKGESSAGDPAVTADLAHQYLMVVLVGTIPFSVSQAYAGTLRETGQTVVPMAASVTGIFTNLCFNWLLIYGHLGFPKWGVYGAAVATTISRFVEIVILVVYMHRRTKRYPFVTGIYRSLYIPGSFAAKVFRTGLPLFMNEFLWSFGMTVINQSYSTYGLGVVAATSIASTTWNLFMIVMMGMGSAVQIIVGQHLGMGQIKEAREIDTKLTFLTFTMNTALGLILIACSGYIPRLFNVDQTVRDLAAMLLVIDGLCLPIESLVHVTYFTIRSGGKTFITFLFDSVYSWVVPVPLAFFLSRYSALDIVTVFAVVQFSSIVKMIIGLFMLRSGFWAKKIV